MLLAVRFWLTSPDSAFVYQTQADESYRDSLGGHLHPQPRFAQKVPLPRLCLRSLTHCPLTGVGGHGSHRRCPASPAGGRVCVDLFEGRWAMVVEIKKAHIL